MALYLVRTPRLKEMLLPYFFLCLAWGGVVCTTGFAQCALVCKQNLQVSLNVNGLAPISIGWIAPTANNLCPGTLELQLQDYNEMPLTNPLDCSVSGQTVTATVLHPASGNSCTTQLEVRDFLPPSATCPDVYVWCHEEGHPAQTGFPAVQDNCTPAAEVVRQWTDQETGFPCGTVQNGFSVKKRINRNWVLTDANGNQRSCYQKIWFKNPTFSDLSFPANRDGVAAPALNCSQNYEDLSLTGLPTLEGGTLTAGLCEMGITNSDQVIPVCLPAGRVIVRTWTAVDFCTGQLLTKPQVIKVEDKTPPQIASVADLTIPTTGIQCAAVVTLPQPLVSDDCSAVTKTASWTFGSGFGPFPEVPVGTHPVTFTATDACGNTQTRTMVVRVTDASPPLAVCKTSLQISVSSDGKAYVTPGMIDGGSLDNCSTVTLQVSANAADFYNNLAFSCTQQGTPVVVTLRASDTGGLSNICQTAISVRDFLKPQITCPPNQTLTCGQDPTDLSLTGIGNATDNCSVPTLGHTDTLSLNACQTGQITRTWTATDDAGNQTSCTQRIAVVPIQLTQVVFPTNKTVACSIPQELLPPATGAPQWSGQGCSELSVTYQDQVSAAPPPYCKRILRAWKVIDWCVYNGQPGTNGIWEHTQLIDILDQQPPQLFVPSDITIQSATNGCEEYVTLQDAVAMDCRPEQILVSHNSPYAQAPGLNGSGIYPFGSHALVFTATDGCGNSVRQTTTVTIQDIGKPKLECKTGQILNLEAGGVAALPPDLITAAISDGCSNTTELQRWVEPAQFDCSSLGLQAVKLYAKDPSGNLAQCATAILVRDLTSACGLASHTIEGGIFTEWGDTVRTIPVQLTGGAVSIWTDCDTSGNFYFESLPADASYVIRPYNNAHWINGVSTFDLLLMSKHILGIQPLNSPYKMVAADANRSGSVTTFDIVLLRKLILGVLDSLPGSSSWRFLPSDFIFQDPYNPFFLGFPEVRVVETLTANQQGLNFIGVKVGDMNNSTNPAVARNPLPPRQLEAHRGSWVSDEHEEWLLTFPEIGFLDGLQFEMEWDTAFVDLLAVNSDLGAQCLGRPANDKLSVSWLRLEDNPGTEVVLRLRMRATGDPFSQGHVRLATDRIPAEYYGGSDEGIGSLTLKNKGTPQPQWQIFPNPTFGPLTLCVENQFPRSMTIYQPEGKTVWHERWEPSNVEHCRTLQFPPSLPTGIYRYKIETLEGNTMQGKVVYLER
jgi:hypothetical protein